MSRLQLQIVSACLSGLGPSVGASSGLPGDLTTRSVQRAGGEEWSHAGTCVLWRGGAVRVEIIMQSYRAPSAVKAQKSKPFLSAFGSRP